MDTRGRAQHENGNVSGDGNESSRGNGNGDKDRNGNGNDDRIGEGGGEAKKGNKRHNSYRRHMENRGDLMERGKNAEKRGLVQQLLT